MKTRKIIFFLSLVLIAMPGQSLLSFTKAQNTQEELFNKVLRRSQQNSLLNKIRRHSSAFLVTLFCCSLLTVKALFKSVGQQPEPLQQDNFIDKGKIGQYTFRKIHPKNVVQQTGNTCWAYSIMVADEIRTSTSLEHMESRIKALLDQRQKLNTRARRTEMEDACVVQKLTDKHLVISAETWTDIKFFLENNKAEWIDEAVRDFSPINQELFTKFVRDTRKKQYGTIILHLNYHYMAVTFDLKQKTITYANTMGNLENDSYDASIKNNENQRFLCEFFDYLKTGKLPETSNT